MPRPLHGGQGMVGAAALVGIDHAGQRPDEQRAVMSEFPRRGRRIAGVDLKMLGGDTIGIGDHRFLAGADGDFAMVAPDPIVSSSGCACTSRRRFDTPLLYVENWGKSVYQAVRALNM